MVWLLYDKNINKSQYEILIWLVRQGHHFLRILNELISQLPFNTRLIGHQHSIFCHSRIPWFIFCHCESTLSLYATYYHCNMHLIFSNTTFYSNINKLQLSIKTITRTGTHTHQHISHICYIHTYTHIKQKQHQQVILKVAELDLCC